MRLFQIEEAIGSTIEVDGVIRPTTNFFGEYLHTSQEGIINFWRWFGDSVVVDRTGRPMVLYHSGDFNENIHTPGHGMHFGTHQAAMDRARNKPNEDIFNQADYWEDEYGWHWETSMDNSEHYLGPGEGFATKEKAKEHAIRIFNEYNFDYGWEEDEDNDVQITEVYLKILNPFKTRDYGNDWHIPIQYAEKNGNDGIIYKNDVEDPGSTSYIIFNSSQVKSVRNNGNFGIDTGMMETD